MFRTCFSIIVISTVLCLAACAPPSMLPPEAPVARSVSSLTLAPTSAGASSSPATSSTPSIPPSTEAPLEPGDVPASAAAVASSSAGPDYALEERLTENGQLEIGKADAPLMLTLFTNISCAYCKQFAEEQLPKLLASFVRNGELLLRIQLVPLQKYPTSRAEAAALICAANARKGSAMHQSLFTLAVRSDAALLKTATDIGIDKTAFETCRASPQVTAFLEAQARAATASGVTLVPTFFLGNDRITGLPDYPDLRGFIERKL